MKATAIFLILQFLLSTSYQQEGLEKSLLENENPTTEPILSAKTSPEPLSTPETLTTESSTDNSSVSPADSSTTEISSSSSSSSTESPSPSTTPSTSTSPSTTTTEPPSFHLPGEGETTKSFFCLCDIYARSCDMNCCCDPDCSAEEKLLFTSCTGSIIYDPSSTTNTEHSCLKSYLMYRDNTPYLVDRKSKNLFCVARENLKHVKAFGRSEMSRISKRISRGRIDSRPKFVWDDIYPGSGGGINMREKPYKYGSVIWIITEENEDSEDPIVETLRYPAPYHTDLCTVQEPVKFLQESVSSCTLPVEDLEMQCATLQELNLKHFIKNFSIILNPANVDENDANPYATTSVTLAKICFNKMDKCGTVESFHETAPSLSSGKCKNVLSQLNLTFFHEGMDGLNRVIAKVLLIDVPVNTQHIVQTFSVDFIWKSNTSKSERDNSTMELSRTDNSVEDHLAVRKLPRSGNPGYIVGKPLILGKKVATVIHTGNDTNNEGNNMKKVERMMVLLDEVSQWLHIQGAGDCPLDASEFKNYPRNSVLFGYEHVSSCRLPLEPFKSCENLQQHIFSVIFGIVQDATKFLKDPPFVAAYGSPDAFPSDWVQLSIAPGIFGSNGPLASGCDAVTNAYHISIAFAYVGPVDAPQAKVTGVFYEPEDPIQIHPVSKGNAPLLQELPVTTTVSFVDVTQQPTSRVATWPVLSIRLPSDFFYPFSSRRGGNPPSSAAFRPSHKEYIGTGVPLLILIVGIFIV